MTQTPTRYFIADTNAKGHTYIQMYETQWDPERIHGQLPVCKG